MKKVVLVTGSAQGLGEQTIYKFAENGYDVVINDYFNFDKAEKVEEYVKNKYGVNCLKIKADISKENDVKNMISEILEKFEKIDVLVNNAGIVEDMDISQRSVELFNKTILNNLSGTYIMIKYVSEIMKKNKSGRIINIASTNGMDCISPDSIDYDASKAGIISLTKNFAKYLAPYITVNSVSPGWIRTDMNIQLGEEFEKEESENIYLKRFADPKEVADVILYLAKDEAKYINGANIVVDGGML